MTLQNDGLLLAHDVLLGNVLLAPLRRAEARLLVPDAEVVQILDRLGEDRETLRRASAERLEAAQGGLVRGGARLSRRESGADTRELALEPRRLAFEVHELTEVRRAHAIRPDGL